MRAILEHDCMEGEWDIHDVDYMLSASGKTVHEAIANYEREIESWHEFPRRKSPWHEEWLRRTSFQVTGYVGDYMYVIALVD